MLVVVDTLNMKINNYCNGKSCACCGECCTTFLPITYKEIKRIKKAIKEHNITYNQGDFLDPENLRLLCPFLDMKTKKCKLHLISSQLKPDICKAFKCSQPISLIEKNKKYYYDRADFNGHNGTVVPMELIFYDNPLPLLVYAIRVLHNDTPDKLLNYLERTGNKDVADAIRDGRIQLEWSDK